MIQFVVRKYRSVFNITNWIKIHEAESMKRLTDDGGRPPKSVAAG